MKMLKSKKLPLLILILVSVQFWANAATRTSTTGGGVWSTGGTWVGGVAPVAGDDVVIDGPVTLSANAQCVSLTINATKTLNTSTFLLTLTGNFTNNGTFTSGAGGITLSGTAAQTINNNIVTTGTFTMAKTGGTATCNGNITAAALTINGAGGTLNLGSVTRTHTFSGNITLTAGTLKGGSSTINANSSTASAWGGTGSVFVADTSTVVMGGNAQTIGGGATTFYNLTFGGSGAKTIGTGVKTINGILTIANQANVNTFTGSIAYGTNGGLVYNVGTSSRTVSAEWPSTFTGLGGVTINGTSPGTITINGHKELGNSTNVPLTINVGGSLAMAFLSMTLHGDFTNNGTMSSINGTFTLAGTGNQNIGNVNAYNIAVTKTGGTATFVGSVAANGPFTMTGAGTVDLGIGVTHDFNLGLSVTNGTLLGNGASVKLAGGNFSITAPGTFTGQNVNLECDGGIQTVSPFTTTGTFKQSNTGGNAVTFLGDMTFGRLELAGGSGTLNLGSGFTHTINGDVFFNGGGLNGNSSTLIVNSTSATAWSGTGSFAQATSTVVFSGGAQTISRLTTFYNLTFSGTGAKTLPVGNTTINNTFTVGNGAFANVYNGTISFTHLIYDAGASNRTTVLEEWPAAFTGSVTIRGTGIITMNGAKQAGIVTIDAGATLATANFTLQFNNNFVNNGTFTAGSSLIIIYGTGNQSIGSISTTGTVQIYKDNGTATLTGNMTADTFFQFRQPGLPNLGVGLIHNFGTMEMNPGTVIQGGSSTINLSGNWTGASGTYTPGTSTVILTGAAQTVAATAFHNLTVAGTGAKTFGTTCTVSGILSLEGTASVIVTTGTVAYGSDATLRYNKGAAYTTTAEEFGTTFGGTGGVVIANTGTITLNSAKALSFNLKINTGATINLGTFTTHTCKGIVFAGAPYVLGEYGGTGSGAVNIDPLYFATALGKITSTTPVATWNTGAGSTDWSLAANWVEATVPDATINTIIPGGGTQPTLTAAASCRDLTVQNGATLTTAGLQLTIQGNFVKNGTGAVTFGSSPVVISGPNTQSIAGISTAGAVTINKAAGTATVAGNISAGSLTITSGTCNLGANVHTITGNIAVAASMILQAGSSTINLGGNFTNAGTFTGGSSNLVLTGTAAQTIAAFSTTGNISMQKTGGTATFNGNIGMGNLTLNGAGGTLDLGASRTHTASGLVTLTNGTLYGGTGTTLLTISGSGNVWSGDGTLFDPGTATGGITFSGGGTVNATGVNTFFNLTISVGGAGITVASDLLINGRLTSNHRATFGTVNYGATAGLVYNGGSHYSTGNEWPATFNGTGGVTLSSTGGSFTVSGNKTMGTGATLTVGSNGATINFGANTLILNGDLISSNLTATGTGTITLTGTANQSIGKLPSTGTLIVNKAGGTATMTSAISPASDVTLVGVGALNLGAALSHTIGNLALNGGSNLNANTSTITLTGNYTNGGGTVANTAFNVQLSGTNTQVIDGFTTTGSLSMVKTGGTATLDGNVSAAAFTMNGSGGTLNLGVGLSHTFSGVLTRTNGILNCSSSTLNLSLTSATVISGTGGTFTVGTGTVNFSGAAQTVPSTITYYNLTLSGSGVKTTTSVTVNNILSLEGTATVSAAISYGGAATLRYNKATGYTATNLEFPATFSGLGGVIIAGTGTITFNAAKNISAAPLVINNLATVNLGVGLTHTSLGLTLAGVAQGTGSYGGTSSAATNINATYFAASTGIINVLSPFNTWLGTVSTNWNTAGNWGNGFVPTNTSDVIIAAAANQPILSANAICRDLTIQTGTTLTTAGFQLSIAGDFANSGTAAFGSSAIEFTGAAAQTIAGFTTTGDVLMNKTGGTATLSGAVSAGSLILNGSGATLNLGPAFIHIFSGDITITAGTLTANSSNIRLNGTGAQTIGAITTLGNITVNKASGTAIFGGNISAASIILNNAGGTVDLGAGRSHTFTGNITVTAGTLLTNTATINLTGTGTQNIGTMSGAGTLVVNKTGTANFIGAITLTNITITAGTLDMGAFTHTISGNISGAGTLNGNTSNIVLTGASAQSIKGITTTGTITVTKTAGTATFAGSCSAASLTVNQAGGTLNLGTGYSHIFPIVTVTDGTLNGGSATVTMSGDLTVTSPGVFTGNAVNITVTGTANQTLDGFITTGILSVTKTANTATLAGAVSLGGLTLNGIGGILHLGTGLTHTVSGTWTRTNGTLDGGSSTLIFTATTPESGTTGSFIANNGTVVFSNAGAQTIPNITYNNLTLGGSGVKTTSASVIVNSMLSLEGTATLSAAITYGSDVVLQYNKAGAYTTTNNELPNTFNGGVYIIGAGTITFNAAKTINGPLSINTGGTVSLNNFAHSSYGLVLNSVPVSVYGTYGRTGSGATNIDNTYFVTTNGTINVTNLELTWNGGTSDDWSAAANWTPAIAPKSYTDVIIPNVTTKPILSVNSSVKNITINTSSSLTTNTKQLTVFGTLNITGSLIMGASTLVLSGAVNQSVPALNLSSGNLVVSKQAGTATLTGNLSVTNLSITRGTLNLGTGVTHTITGNIGDLLGGLVGNAANITFSGGAVQNIIGLTTTGNITVNKGANSATFTGNMNIGGLTLTAGTVNLGTGTHTFSGNIVRTAGTFNGATANIIITGTAAQNIYGFTTTGNVTVTKTLGVATFTTNMSAGALTIDGVGGTLNLGSALTHTFSGDIVLTNGTLNGGSSTINVNSTSATAWSGTSGTFTPSTSTVVLGGAAQTIAKTTTFYELVFGGTGAKTIAGSTTTTVNDTFTIANGASVNVYTGTLVYGAAATLYYSAGSSNRTVLLTEWPNSFLATGGVVIGGTGTITFGNAGGRTLGSNTNVPLRINAGANLTSTGFNINFHGDFINNGTFVSGGSNISVTGTVNPQSIAGFSTTGSFGSSKTGGTATLTGNVSAAAFSITAVGGTLNMGTGLTHTFTGDITLTNGTLNGGSSTINANSSTATAWTGTGTNFTAGTSTVVLGGAAQTIATATTFYNLTCGGSGIKTLGANTTVSGALTLSNKLRINTNTLTLNGSVSGMSSTNSLSSNKQSNIVIGGTGAFGTLFFDQTSLDSTNALNNITINRAAQVATLGSTLVVNGTTTVTAGMLGLGGQSLTLNGASSIVSGGLRGSTASTINLNYAAANTVFSFDQSTPGTTNALNLLSLNIPAAQLSTDNAMLISDSLVLTAGDLVGTNVSFGNAATIQRSNGAILTAAPTFGTSVNVSYTAGSDTTITTGFEMPTSSTVLQRLTIDKGTSTEVKLAGATTVNNVFTVASGKCNLNGQILTLAGSSSIIAQGLRCSPTSSLAVTYTGGNTLLGIEQSTFGVNNALKTLTIASGAALVNLNNTLVVMDTLQFVSGKLNMNGQYVYIYSSIVNNVSQGLRGSLSSRLFLYGSTSDTVSMDQTTPGTTNALHTLSMNRTSQVATLGAAMVIANNATVNLGKLNLGGQSLTLNGTLSTPAQGLVGRNGSLIINYNVDSTTLNLDQTTPGTTNALNNLTINVGTNQVVLGSSAIINGTFSAPALGNKLKINGNTLTLAGPSSMVGQVLRGSSTSRLLVTYTAGNTTISIDQTTPNTTNLLKTINIASGANVVSLSNSLSNSLVLLDTLLFTSGKLSLNGQGLYMTGRIVNNVPQGLRGSTTSVLFFQGTGSDTLSMDQTTPGTTNALSTLNINRASHIITLGGALTVTNGTTVTNGKLNINGQLLTLNGSLSTPSQGLIGRGGSVIVNYQGGNTTLDFDQSVDQTTNMLTNLTVNVGAANQVILNNKLRMFGGSTTFTSGKFNLNGQALELGGSVLNTVSENIIGGTTSSLTLFGTQNRTVSFDQSNPGTSNYLNTLSLTLNTPTVEAILDKPIVVNGLTYMGAGILNINGQTVTMNGSITYTSGVFKGSNTSSIVLGGSVSSTLNMDQTIPGTTNRLGNLTYNRSGQTITLGNAVEIKGVVTPTGGTLATGGNLKLISDATGDASIAAGTGSYITGNVTVERYIPASARGWRFMASPVTSSTLQDWQGEFHITGAGGATNGFDPTISNQSGAYSYDETATGDLNQGWIAPASITEPLTPGKGFRLFLRGDRTPGRLDGTITTQNAITVNSINPVNTGDINLAPTFTSTGMLANDGWNFKGNPYPSAIDWNAFHDAGRTGSTPDYSGTDYAHLDATVYVLDAGAVAYSSYNAFSGAVVGQLTGGVIPSGAAFWVKASAGSPAMMMKEIYKSAAQPGMMFKNGGLSNPQFKIQLIASDISYDETVIRYENAATSGYDAYDIAKMYGSNVNIASIGSDNQFLAANYKPFNGVSDTIPLSVGIAQTGTYTLKFIDPDFLHASLPIYLVDSFLNKKVNVRSNPTYVFNVDKTNSNTSGNNRFTIVVGQQDTSTSVAVEEIPTTVEKLILYPSVTSGIITILGGSTVGGRVDIEIVDVTGKIHAKHNGMEWNANELKLDLSPFQAGVYFIRLSGSTQKSSITLKCIRE